MEKLEKGFTVISHDIMDAMASRIANWVVFERDHDPLSAIGKDFQKCQRCGEREELPYKFEPAIKAMHDFLDKHAGCKEKK